MLLTRRRLLLGTGAAALAGCTTERADAPSPTPSADPDALLRAAAQEREQLLLDAYGSRTDVAALAATVDHRAHLLALGGVAVPPRPSRAGTRALEATTATQHAAAALSASPELAQLLASLAACESSHALLP